MGVWEIGCRWRFPGQERRPRWAFPPVAIARLGSPYREDVGLKEIPGSKELRGMRLGLLGRPREVLTGAGRPQFGLPRDETVVEFGRVSIDYFQCLCRSLGLRGTDQHAVFVSH